jgi:hypothetical protein
VTGRVTRQSRQRLLKCRLSRSDDRGQGRRQPASAARGPLTAGRRGGYPLLTPVLIQPATRVRSDGGNSKTLRTCFRNGERMGEFAKRGRTRLR